MATPAQIAANKSNALKSTGPVTPEGKAHSRLNHIIHGCTSAVGIAVIDGEDKEEFERLLASLVGEYQPATPTEQILVEKMAHHQWISQRALRLQAFAFNSRVTLAQLFALPPDLSLLIRYQRTAETSFHQAHKELVKCQKERKDSQIGFVPQTAVQASEAPADPPRTEPKTADFPPLAASLPQPATKHAAEFAPEPVRAKKTAA